MSRISVVFPKRQQLSLQREKLLLSVKAGRGQRVLGANRQKLTRYKQVEGVKNNEAKFNEMIRMVERSSSLDADQKATRI